MASRLTDKVTVAPACFLADVTAESAVFLMVNPARTKIKIALVTKTSNPVHPFLAFVTSQARLIKFMSITPSQMYYEKSLGDKT
jgi:hypothetical protein